MDTILTPNKRKDNLRQWDFPQSKYPRPTYHHPNIYGFKDKIRYSQARSEIVHRCMDHRYEDHQPTRMPRVSATVQGPESRQKTLHSYIGHGI